LVKFPQVVSSPRLQTFIIWSRTHGRTARRQNAFGR